MPALNSKPSDMSGGASCSVLLMTRSLRASASDLDLYFASGDASVTYTSDPELVLVCDVCNGNVIPKKTVLLNGRNVTCAKVQNLADKFPKNLCPHAFKNFSGVCCPSYPLPGCGR